MEILTLILMMTITVFFLSFVPMLQMFVIGRRTREQTEFEFDSELVNYDTDNLKFENAQAFYERANNRVLADSRGSIRQANGKVHDSKSFEEAKREVYSIALP